MSNLIERIRLVLSPYRNFNHHIAVVDELIELIDDESAKEPIKTGHYGCNSNGEHERCGILSCAWYDKCIIRNSIWFDDESAKEPQECDFKYTGHGEIENRELKSNCGHHFSEKEIESRKWTNCPYCGGTIKIS